MGLEPAADGAESPLPLGRDALGDVVIGSRPVVEALGTGLQIAVPPLAEPGLAAAQGGADLLERATSETETEGALTRSEFVVHGVPRGATAGGCLQGTS